MGAMSRARQFHERGRLNLAVSSGLVEAIGYEFATERARASDYPLLPYEESPKDF